MRRMIGVCLLVAGMLVFAASSASARLPELGYCYGTETGSGGKYSNPGCTVRAPQKKGGYEWRSLEEEWGGHRFSLASNFTFETAGGRKIECATVGGGGNTSTYFIPVAGAITPYWEFDGCESEGKECNSQFSFLFGEINNRYAWRHETWVGSFGFIEGRGGPSPVVGLSYKVENDEPLFEPVLCSGPIGTVLIGGYKKGGNSFIARMSPVNEMTEEFHETFSESAPGIQSPSSFEGHPDVIYANVEGKWERVAMVGEITYHGSEPLEIKASN